jgi:DNA invertase Pin-like site-specific DNA recombinase
MIIESKHKITTHHLARKAFVYIRQSSVRQVFENTESTKRQYDLHKAAVALGWPADQIIVIDSDLGQSGASRDREGFQKLVAEVGLGHAGVVLSLEVSRLARNCSDWHQLLEICALTGTLIVDESGLYDPAHFNDRLLLGLKGTMSEAELYIMRARLRGGQLNKARRGELELPLPIGFVYDQQGRVVLDPDKQVQDSVRLLFKTFTQVQTAYATAAYFHTQNLKFPFRIHGGLRHGELQWGTLAPQRVVALLHNPRYAGAFAYGREQLTPRALGRQRRRQIPREQWHALVLDAHPGYISWAEHEANMARLRQTASTRGIVDPRRPPREGPALLQGLIVCGACGARMTTRYAARHGQRFPYYECRRKYQYPGGSTCTSISGITLDAAMARLVVDSLTPAAVDVALDVERELRERVERSDRLLEQQVERARYQAEAARRRFMQVDPDNRLVAGSLETQWNDALRAVNEAEQTLEQQRTRYTAVRDPEDRDRMMSMCREFPALWDSPTTQASERKRMLRLLIEDVTVHKRETITAHIRFRGGATTTLSVQRPLANWEKIKTPASVVAEVDKLLSLHTCSRIAELLNEQGKRMTNGALFDSRGVKSVVANYHLKTFKQRLRDQGLIGASELASRLGVNIASIYLWQRQGRIAAIRCNDRGELAYHPDTRPGEVPPPGQGSASTRVAVIRGPGRSTPGGAV